ncbi:MAG: TlpA family protein disulfide reductase [Anaerolineae bacterium]|nr:TlpA family protein disulfide reductase [Anaerolineae bacterium]
MDWDQSRQTEYRWRKDSRSPRGFAAPDFTLSTPAGEVVTLSDLQGRPVIINLWASWCGPCRAEMPALQRVHEAYQDQGLVILAVNATYQDSQSAALAFVAEHGLTFPVLLDQDGQASELYELRALPSTYFVRPDGIIEESSSVDPWLKPCSALAWIASYLICSPPNSLNR